MLVVAVAVASQRPLLAAERATSAGAYVDQREGPTAVAGTVSLSATPQGSGGGGTVIDSICEWRVIIEDDEKVAVFDVDGRRQRSPTGRWFERWCGGQQEAVTGAFGVPEGAPVLVDPAELAAQARESVQVPAPSIATSPAADRRLYVQVPTWLWLPKEWWQGYSATAEAGGVSATVSVTPVRAVWSTGDGGDVTCVGPGVAWRPGLPEDGSDCFHDYRHSSATQAGGTFTLSVTVDFEVAWTSSVGAGGPLPGITRTASRPVEVGEIQAVETG